MAGITKFIAGEEAVARDVYWNSDDGLAFDLELEQRVGGHSQSQTTASDYASDIGIDPKIEPGDRVKFIELDAYSGLWTLSGTELNMSHVEAAIKRVTLNRALADSQDKHHSTAQEWLQELATQTRRPVKSLSQTIQPQAVAHLRRFSQPILHWLGSQETHLMQLDESSFERLLMTLIDRMGYHVKMVGETNQKDGGIDLIAWPRHGLPHLVAVQAKHHSVQRKTSVGDVRDFCGALHAHPAFSFGLLVTNTSFTADAEEYASRVKSKIRLRAGGEVCRWLNNDVAGEADWLPDEIDLALGVTTPLTVGPKLTDMGHEVRRVRTILDMFLPTADTPRDPFGTLFPDG